MTQTDPVKSVVAEAPSGAKGATVTAEKRAAKVELDGDELIQFTIKPSLWFILIASYKWILATALLGAAVAVTMQTGHNPKLITPFQLLAGVAALVVVIATLQWATRLYVLTTRRVMRFKGSHNVDVVACPLNRISGVALNSHPLQRLLRLGSIHITPADPGTPTIVWEHLAHPDEVHDRLMRAIRKSQSRD
jgi:membrane protein YdbS with pleckstrin-like domain